MECNDKLLRQERPLQTVQNLGKGDSIPSMPPPILLLCVLALEDPEATLQTGEEEETEGGYQLSHLSQASVIDLNYPSWEKRKTWFSFKLGTERPLTIVKLFWKRELTPNLP